MTHVSRLAVQQNELNGLLQGIDQGIQDHLAWNQKLIRWALMHERPDEDMLRSDSYQSCQFGRWLVAQRRTLIDFDEAATIAVDQNHQRMHAAVCALCEGAVEQKPAHLTDVQAYEAAQTAMIDGLHVLRQRVVDAILHFDALTGLPLRNGLEYAFHIRRKDAIRQGVPLYVAMIDVDFFKRINDTWGHPVGDLALQHLARLMTACLRDNDIAVRYGGEEFLFLLLGHEAEKVTQRILEEVRQHPMPMEGSMALPMTVTAGLTVVSPSDSLASAVDRADQALLTGKHSGRDRHVLALL